MEICILSIGKINTDWISKGISVFDNRLKKYVKFSSVSLPDIKNSKNLGVPEIKEEEGKLILSYISSADFVILMDEKGKEYTSREFALRLQKHMATGYKRIIFLVGGPFGFSQKVYERGNELFSLSKMTFTHEMAKLFLTEQIYRAMTILKGEPYHHD